LVESIEGQWRFERTKAARKKDSEIEGRTSFCLIDPDAGVRRREGRIGGKNEQEDGGK